MLPAGKFRRWAWPKVAPNRKRANLRYIAARGIVEQRQREGRSTGRLILVMHRALQERFARRG